TRSGDWIVRAMDRLRDDVRTFRVDRITDVRAVAGPRLLDRPAVDAERAALARIRADIAQVDPAGVYRDAARWTPAPDDTPDAREPTGKEQSPCPSTSTPHSTPRRSPSSPASAPPATRASRLKPTRPRGWTAKSLPDA